MATEIRHRRHLFFYLHHYTPLTVEVKMRVFRRRSFFIPYLHIHNRHTCPHSHSHTRTLYAAHASPASSNNSDACVFRRQLPPSSTICHSSPHTHTRARVCVRMRARACMHVLCANINHQCILPTRLLHHPSRYTYMYNQRSTCKHNDALADTRTIRTRIRRYAHAHTSAPVRMRVRAYASPRVY